MQVLDTNILLYAADRDAEFHTPCLNLIRACGQDTAPSYLTWSICYEFLRVVTHPRVFRNPWKIKNGRTFLESLLSHNSFSLLIPGEHHQRVLHQTIEELPEIRGNLVHDLNIATLMREHGISRIYTRDTDFHRFPFVTVLDPLR